MIPKNEFLENCIYYCNIRKAYITNPEWQIRRRMRNKTAYTLKCKKFIEKVTTMAKKKAL